MNIMNFNNQFYQIEAREGTAGQQFMRSISKVNGIHIKVSMDGFSIKPDLSRPLTVRDGLAARHPLPVHKDPYGIPFVELYASLHKKRPNLFNYEKDPDVVKVVNQLIGDFFNGNDPLDYRYAIPDIRRIKFKRQIKNAAEAIATNPIVRGDEQNAPAWAARKGFNRFGWATGNFVRSAKATIDYDPDLFDGE